MDEPRKWSWVEFFVGFLNKKLLVWGISTFFVVTILYRIVFDKTPADGSIDTVFNWIIIGGWLLLSVIYMLSNSIEKAVENAKISMELKAGAQANVNAEMNKVIEAVKSIKNGGTNG